jgi:Tfp pilus assembly protein FimV
MVNLRQGRGTLCNPVGFFLSSGRTRLCVMGGLLAIFAVPGHGLEIGKATVYSRQGEPLDALVRITIEPAARFDNSCLSAGTQSVFPESDYKLLTDGVRMRLEPDRKAIRISTGQPLREAAVSIAVRARCLRGPVTVRAFNLHLLPPAANVQKTAERPERATVAGTVITVQPGDSIYGLARTIYPGNEDAVRALASAIVSANPAIFPDGRARGLDIGESLIIPNLRTVAAIGPAEKARPAARTRESTAGNVHASVAQPVPQHPTSLRLKLARTLDLTRSRGTDENRRSQLGAQASGALTAASTRLPRPEPALASRLDTLINTQKQIDARLARLETTASALQTIINRKPKQQQAIAPVSADPGQLTPPTIASVLSGTRLWWQWAGIAIGLAVLVAGSIVLGRKWYARRTLSSRQSRIEQMLEQARFEAAPLLESPTAQPASTHRSRNRVVNDAANAAASAGSETVHTPGLRVRERDKVPTLHEQTTRSAGSATRTDEAFRNEVLVSTGLRQEMDDSLDSARSMFSDIDRYIALGRIQNAISLLEFQIEREPDDRTAWIKLMAVYRHNRMNDDFDRVYASYCERFNIT